MIERPYELARTAEGVVARIRLRGRAVLASPLLNPGTAFVAAERAALGLTGLLTEAVCTKGALLTTAQITPTIARILRAGCHVDGSARRATGPM